MTLVGANVLTTAILRRQAANAAETRIPPGMLEVRGYPFGGSIYTPQANVAVDGLAWSTATAAQLDETWYWHVVSLTYNGNAPESAGEYVAEAALDVGGVTIASSGDVISNPATLPNLTNPLNNQWADAGGSGVAGADVDRVFVDVVNFNGEPTSGTAYDEAVNVLTGTWQHFNTEWSTDPEIILLSSVPEQGVLSVPWTGGTVGTCTRQDFDAWSSFAKSSARRAWFTSTLVSGAQADEPSGTFAAIDVMAYIWDAIRGTDLNDFTPTDWYSDAAPHGNPDWYALLGMTIWTIMMDRQSVSTVEFPWSGFVWETGVTTAFQNAAQAASERLVALVQGTAVTPNAPQTDEIDVTTGTGSREVDVTINSLPETVIAIQYRWAHGSGSWLSLSRTTAGDETIQAPAGSTAYAMEWRYVTAAGNGQGSTANDDDQWTVTSAAASGTTSNWPAPENIAVESYAWSTSGNTVSNWPAPSDIAVESYAWDTNNNTSSNWPAPSNVAVESYAWGTVTAGGATWSSWATAGTVAEGSDGADSWADAPTSTNLGADDANAATLLGGGAGNLSNTVTLTNFGFSTTGTVTGVEVRFTDLVEGIGGDRPWDITNLDLVNATGTTAKTNVLPTKVSQGAGGSSPQTVTIGGETDLWLGSLTSAQANATAFGISFQTLTIDPTVDGNPLHSIDMIEVRVRSG